MTASIWTQDSALPAFLSLNRDLTCDVCVIGGGLAGITSAFLLARRGVKVTLLEARQICGGETSRTTAHIVTAHDDRYYNIEKSLGKEIAASVASSYLEAIQFIELTARRINADCDFRRLDGYLFPFSDDDRENLSRELAACRSAGLQDVELLEIAPGIRLNTGPCLKFPNQATFHPLKYVNALLSELVSMGVNVFAWSRATEVKEGCEVKLENGSTVKCGRVVVATNSPVNTVVAVHTKQAPYRTYALAAEYSDESADALLWDTGKPYHYVRFQKTRGETPGRNLIIAGGEDHKTGQADDGSARLSSLEKWTRERFPATGSILATWSGQVMETIDGLPFIGEEQKNIYLITGDSGTGMTHATIGAITVSDLILSGSSPWAEIYKPQRRTISSGFTYLKENLNAAGQFLHWAGQGEIQNFNNLTPGTGMIVKHGVKKVGIYKGEQGELYAVSLVCRHVGCPVSWNSLERSWDCPCHGSRYNFDGTVICGPAHSPLERLDPVSLGGDPAKSVSAG